jgi:serine protease Do
MSVTDQLKSTGGKIARHRKSLLAGAMSLGLVGVFAVEGFLPGVTDARAQNARTTIDQPASPLNVQGFSFAPVVDKVRPAVVSIRVRGERANPRQSYMDSFPDIPEGSPLERFFREFGAPNGQNRPGDNGRGQQRGEAVMSQGSGFIISPDGKVVTNFHVVKGATEVTVLTDDGNEYKAKVLGSDEKTDVALVKIDDARTDFPTVSFAPADIRVGDWVLAVGNPFGLGGSVTAGIVSARGREIGAGPYDDFLQIDAPINRGNSGGPTFSLNGEVVGVNTAIYSPSGGSVGIGFAIPAETVQKVIAQLEKNGEVVRGWLGVQIQPINRDIADGLGMKDARGALVAEPQKDSPAAKAGIKAGDAILGVEGKPVRNPRDLARTIAGYEPGATVRVTLLRAGKEQDVKVQLGRLPDEARLADNGGNKGSDGAQPTALAELGMKVAPATDVGKGNQGVVVVEVDPRGAAARRDIDVGDVILDVQGRSVATAADVTGAVKDARQEGRRAVLLRVQKGDNTRFVPLPITRS